MLVSRKLTPYKGTPLWPLLIIFLVWPLYFGFYIKSNLKNFRVAQENELKK